MVKVLVVCSANMARSQSLAHYLRALSEESKLPVLIRSAGIDKAEIKDIWEGQKYKGNITPSPKIRAFMSEPELMIPGKPPQLTPATLINKRMVGWADVVIAADAHIERWLKQHYPREQKKVRLSTHYSRGSGKRKQPTPRIKGEIGMKDAAWPRNVPNPTEYESGTLRGTPEAHRKMLAHSMETARATVKRWNARVPFQTPRQRKKRVQLQRKRGR